MPKFTTTKLGTMPGGKLFFYTDNTLTTLKKIFKDSAGKIDAANPAILDKSGTVPEFFTEGTYSVRHTDQNDVQQWVVDNYGGDVSGSPLADWNETLSYSIGDLVTASDGCRYQSISNDNLNNDPANEANPASWEKILFVRVWNTNITYVLNDVVRASDGEDYQNTVASNLGNDPTINGEGSWTIQTLTPVVVAAASQFAYKTF